MQIQRRKICDLKPHPQQGGIYNDLSDHEFQSLKDDIAKHGLRQPIEITADGTIIDGHHRARALQELGIEEVDVIIVDETTDEAIEERYLYANLLRRQRDPVTTARAFKRLAEIETKRSGVRVDLHTNQSFRDRLATMIGNVSGRTIDRYLQLLRLERELQDAVAVGKLPLTTALKIESLPPSNRQAIAHRIAANESPRKVIAEYFPRKRAVESDTPEDLYHDFLAFLNESLDELLSHTADLPGTVETSVPPAELLSRAAQFCEKMKTLESNARN